MLDFWNIAAEHPDRSDPLGWALMRAKDRYPIEDDYTHRKMVQIYTYFGVPWMRLPGHADAQTAALPPGDSTALAWSEPSLHAGRTPSASGAIEATFTMTASIDASSYAISTTVDGFDLIKVEGLSQRLANGQVVVPRATLDVILPLGATVTSLVFTPTQSVVLPTLDIPTLFSGMPIPGGSTGGYTTTLEATYPATATFEAHALDTYQLV